MHCFSTSLATKELREPDACQLVAKRLSEQKEPLYLVFFKFLYNLKKRGKRFAFWLFFLKKIPDTYK
jgi:hypothetical protein